VSSMCGTRYFVGGVCRWWVVLVGGGPDLSMSGRMCRWWASRCRWAVACSHGFVLYAGVGKRGGLWDGMSNPHASACRYASTSTSTSTSISMLDDQCFRCRCRCPCRCRHVSAPSCCGGGVIDTSGRRGWGKKTTTFIVARSLRRWLCWLPSSLWGFERRRCVPESLF
jgi:hypothetical protein